MGVWVYPYTVSPVQVGNRGSGGKNVIFQIAHMTKVSTQIHTSMCQYDVYKVSSKKMSGRGPSGV